MKHKTSLYCAALLSLTGNAIAQNVPQLGKAPTDTVIAAMTLNEKISLLIGSGEADTTTTGTAPFPKNSLQQQPRPESTCRHKPPGSNRRNGSA